MLFVSLSLRLLLYLRFGFCEVRCCPLNLNNHERQLYLQYRNFISPVGPPLQLRRIMSRAVPTTNIATSGGCSGQASPNDQRASAFFDNAQFAIKTTGIKHIKDKIAHIQTKFRQAEGEKDMALIIKYGNQLIELQKESNQHLTSQGKSRPTRYVDSAYVHCSS